MNEPWSWYYGNYYKFGRFGLPQIQVLRNIGEKVKVKYLISKLTTLILNEVHIKDAYLNEWIGIGSPGLVENCCAYMIMLVDNKFPPKV